MKGFIEVCFIFFYSSISCWAGAFPEAPKFSDWPSPITRIHPNAEINSGIWLYFEDIVNYFWGPSAPSRAECELPFEYASIPQKHEAKRAFLAEKSVIVSTPDTPAYAVLGPLSPCIGIILHNTRNDHVLIAHKSCDADLRTLTPFIKQLEIKDPRDLRLTLYSAHMLEHKYKGDHHLLSCKNHSQEKEHAITHQFLKMATGIPSSNIKDLIYYSCEESHSFSDERNSDNCFFLLIDPQGSVFHTNLFSENYFDLRGSVLRFLSQPDGGFMTGYDLLDVEHQSNIAMLAAKRLAERFNLANLKKTGLEKIVPYRSLDLNYGAVPFYDYRDLEAIEQDFYLRTIDLDNPARDADL